MRKFCFSFIFLFITSVIGSLSAIDGAIEFRANAFFPSSGRFKEVYENVGINYELQASIRLCGPYEVWGNFDWYEKSKKHHDCCKSKIRMETTTMGLNYVFPTCYCLEPYLGLGLSFGRVVLHNRSCCLNEKVSKISYGGVVKSGLRYYFCGGIFLDGFVDYLYQPVDYHHQQNVGGVKVGLGVGYAF